MRLLRSSIVPSITFLLVLLVLFPARGQESRWTRSGEYVEPTPFDSFRPPGLLGRPTPPFQEYWPDPRNADEEPEYWRDVERRIQNQLDQPVLSDLAFDDIAFHDVLDFLRDVTGANVYVDHSAVERAGIDINFRNFRVTVRIAKGTSVAAALQQVLDSQRPKLKLGFTIGRGIVIVTSEEEMQRVVQTRIYDVRDLLVPPGADAGDYDAEPQAERGRRSQALVRLITGSVAPFSWHPNPAQRGLVTEVNGDLKVVQSRANLAAVENLLAHVRAIRR